MELHTRFKVAITIGLFINTLNNKYANSPQKGVKGKGKEEERIKKKGERRIEEVEKELVFNR